MHFYLCVWVFLQVRVTTLSLCCFKSVAVSVLFTIIHVSLSRNKVICTYSLHSFNVLTICRLSNFDNQKMRKISYGPSVHEIAFHCPVEVSHPKSVWVASSRPKSLQCYLTYSYLGMIPGGRLCPLMSITWQCCACFREPLIPTTLSFNLLPNLLDPPGPCPGKGEEPQLRLLCSLLDSSAFVLSW